MNEAIPKFVGEVIVIIQRKDDVEEKWVVAPRGKKYSAEEIMDKVSFVEQYFDSEVRM